MKHCIRPSLAAAVSLGLIASSPAAMAAADQPSSSSSSSRPIVDAAAFRDKPAYDRKKATTIQPATVRMIVPGMNKDAIYRIVGTPHFGETISRRFNYILNLTATGEAGMRCRMQVVFGKPDHQPVVSDHTAVSQILWQTQPCADRVAAG